MSYLGSILHTFQHIFWDPLLSMLVIRCWLRWKLYWDGSRDLGVCGDTTLSSNFVSWGQVWQAFQELLWSILNLRPHIGHVPTKMDELPRDVVYNHPLVFPLAILTIREEIIYGKPLVHALVQWKRLSLPDTSWEHWHKVHALYNFEDNVGFDRKGNIMS